MRPPILTKPAPANNALRTELAEYVKTLPPDLPYEELMPRAAEAGWSYRLEQVEVRAEAVLRQNPNQTLATHNTQLLVTFEVYAIKGDAELPFGPASIWVNHQMLDVSFAARVQLIPTLNWLFFGRLPPAVPQTERQEAAAGEPVTVDMGSVQGDVALPKVEEAPSVVGQKLIPDRVLIRERTPDGIPVFADLYELGEDVGYTDTIIDNVTRIVRDWAAGVDTDMTLTVFGQLNKRMIEFISDLGTPTERAALIGVIDERRATLRAPPVLRRSA